MESGLNLLTSRINGGFGFQVVNQAQICSPSLRVEVEVSLENGDDNPFSRAQVQSTYEVGLFLKFLINGIRGPKGNSIVVGRAMSEWQLEKPAS
jgi:hypothetical protein